jgi:mevalonate kinase
MVQDTPQSYYAHGKLLITGEYLVLAGAKALAIPLKYGQRLTIEYQATHFLQWTATTPQGRWFTASYDEALNVVDTDHQPLAERLASILKTCVTYRDDIRELLRSAQVTTQLEYNPDWGWGSSSTLISLLAQWLGVQPYLLLQDTFGGSGYDIACATASSAITYQLTDGMPQAAKVAFQPAFSEHIYCVYSGRKQSSQQAIARFNKHAASPQAIARINTITDQLLQCHQLPEFSRLIEEHEEIISDVVQLNKIKSEHYGDFRGSIKALGAWGGDFIMAVSEEPAAYVKSYFAQHGLSTIFKLNDIKLG